MTDQADRILVVDDLPDNLVLVEAMLSLAGYTVDTAQSGLAALERIQESPPDLLILDVMMPGINGIETTRRLKSQVDLPFIPVLLLTASSNTSLIEGLDAGADEFIRKPVDQNELLARVRALLRFKHSVDERDFIARQREDFVSRLTHDLRTPLVAAERMFTLLLDGALGTIELPVQEAVSTLRTSNLHLLNMTNSLLEVYRYEAGRKQLHCEEIFAQPLFKEIHAEFSPLALLKEVQLVFEIPENLMVYADVMELRRIIQNLLGNALKFTDAGGVVSIVAEEVEQGTSIAVTDTGCGIAPTEQVHLFNRFVQGNHFRGGTGLGLHHTKQIVEAHGGRILVHSVPKEGSTFTVYLPCSITIEG